VQRDCANKRGAAHGHNKNITVTPVSTAINLEAVKFFSFRIILSWGCRVIIFDVPVTLPEVAMSRIRILFASLVWLVGAGTAPADDTRTLKVHTQRGQPAVERVTVYRTKDGKRESVGELTKLDQPLALPADGPFAVWVKPKDGIAVKALDKLTVKAGQTHDLKLGDVLGAVEVFGDNFPRADKVVITDPSDPGPGEKGHVAVQVASDYRVEMLVPVGTYAVWVVPANGAKAQRVEDNVRVPAGRSVRVGG
jgi:hypothetical protein